MSLPSVVRSLRSLRPGTPAGAGRIAALDRSQAVIEFTHDGVVRDANANFLDTFGCRLVDVAGRHHRMFMPDGEADRPDYAAFWARLARGEFASGRFRRRRPDGRDVWLQATYNPVLDGSGRVTGVIKFASDVTEQVRREADVAGSSRRSTARWP